MEIDRGRPNSKTKREQTSNFDAASHVEMVPGKCYLTPKKKSFATESITRSAVCPKEEDVSCGSLAEASAALT